MPVPSDNMEFTAEDIAKAFGDALKPYQREALAALLNSFQHGRQGFAVPMRGKTVLIDTLAKKLQGKRPDVVIVDEAHRYGVPRGLLKRKEWTMPKAPAFDWRQAQRKAHRNRVR